MQVYLKKLNCIVLYNIGNMLKYTSMVDIYLKTFN